MAKINENSKMIYDFVLEHCDEKDMTAAEIAAELGLSPASVNGSVTSWQRKGVMARVDGGVGRDSKGKAKNIKYIKMTDEGRHYDFNDEE